ncbi:AAA family ATPase [Nocardia aobensis]|uniref:AAA family ATPase n=1 Tax=Nocardia aobensis TaxID=257277 RepID=A0ABW6PDR6_9NOCA
MTRSAHLETLRSTFRAVCDGMAAVALVGGGVGMGKSTLLQTFVEELSDGESSTLIARSSTTECDLAMGVVAQLAGNPRVSPEHRARVGELLNRLSTTGAAPLGQVSQAVLEMVLDLAARGPVVIGIDDLHHIDEPSLRVLLYCSLRWASSRVLLVLTESPDTPTRYPALRSDLLAGPHSRHIRLSPLSDTEIASLVPHDRHPNTAERVSQAIARICGGNPLFVRALVDDLGTAGGRGDVTTAVGEAYAEAVVRFLRRSSSEARTILHILVAFAEPPTPALLTEIAGVSTDSIARLIDQLTRAGLLSGYAFRHPAAAAAVHDDLPAHRLTHLRTAVATALHQHGAPARVVSDYLVGSGTTVEPWAIPLLREAAGQAEREGDFAVAVDFLSLAHRSVHDDRLRAMLAVSRAETEWHWRPSVGATRFALLADSIGRGLLHGEEALTIVRNLLWHGEFEDARYALETLVDRVEDQDAAQLTAFLRWVRCTYPLLLAPPAAEAAPVHSRPAIVALTNPRVHVANLLSDLMAGANCPDIEREAEYILRNCGPTELARYPLVSAIEVLVYSGALDAAESWCATLAQRTVVRNSPAASALLMSLRAEGALRRGELPLAVDLAGKALWLLTPQGWGVGIGSPLATLVLAHTAMGELSEARRVVDIAVPMHMAETRFGARYHHARGHFYLATEQPHAAIRDFQLCGELLQRGDIDNPELVPWRTDLARAYLAIGHDAEARRLAEDQLATVGPGPSVPRALALRVLASCSPQHRRAALLNEAVQILSTRGGHLELTLALFQSSEVEYAAGHAVPARMILRRAQRMADVAGIRLPVDNGEPSVGADAPEATHQLTAAEHRAATLAAQGFTNREVAAKLFVSVSTVEQHLSKVYRKLNVKSRRDLTLGLLA